MLPKSLTFILQSKRTLVIKLKLKAYFSDSVISITVKYLCKKCRCFYIELKTYEPMCSFHKRHAFVATARVSANNYLKKNVSEQKINLLLLKTVNHWVTLQLQTTIYQL